jgi:hypothetical protein
MGTSLTSMMGSGLPQAMIDVMETAMSGASTMTTVMQGMLDAMDDLAGSSSLSSATGLHAMQSMAATMETVISGTAAGTVSSTSAMLSMLNTMESILTNGATQSVTISPATSASAMSTMMVSTGGHVLATTMDRAHLGITQNAGGYMVSATGTAAQTTQMAAGMDTIIATDGQIMMGVNNSVAGSVWRLYESALGRQPDATGFQQWISVMQNGMSAQQVAQSFMSSQEFQSKYGVLTDGQFLDQLYHNVLNRSPDAAGLTGWTDAMAHGMTRDVVLLGFANSAENMANTATHAGANGYWLL